MANPFPSRFDSTCNSCGEPIYEGDDTFAVDGDFICKDCAEAGDNICECGKFKKEGFDQCYECHIKETEPQIDYGKPPF